VVVVAHSLATCRFNYRLTTRIEPEKDAEAKKEASDTSADRKQASLRIREPNLPSTYVAPRNEVERTIARMYEELLGIMANTAYDDSSMLGGHSLVGIH